MVDSVWPLLQAPIFINWNLTYACPLNCLHCYSRGRDTSQQLVLSEKLAIADNIVESGVFFVNFGGGEPLCDADLLPVIQRLSNHGVYVNVSTSGCFVDQERADALVTAGLCGIIVSLDGADPAVHDRIRNYPGAFYGAIECIRLFVERSTKVTLSTVITKENLYHMDEILRLAESLGCDAIELKRMKTVGNALTATDLMLEKADEEYLYAHIREWDVQYGLDIRLIYSPTYVPGYDTGCPCGKSAMTILSNGDLSACAYSPVVIGNALRNEIRSVWTGHEALKEYRKSQICPGLQWRQNAEEKGND